MLLSSHFLNDHYLVPASFLEVVCVCHSQCIGAWQLLVHSTGALGWQRPVGVQSPTLVIFSVLRIPKNSLKHSIHGTGIYVPTFTTKINQMQVPYMDCIGKFCRLQFHHRRGKSTFSFYKSHCFTRFLSLQIVFSEPSNLPEMKQFHPPISLLKRTCQCRENSHPNFFGMTQKKLRRTSKFNPGPKITSST